MSVVEQLSIDIKKLFNGTTAGFSSRNLWDMRRFYLEYKDFPNLRQLVAEIPWGQHLMILNRTKDIAARTYYLRATCDMGWTRNVLGLQIEFRQKLNNLAIFFSASGLFLFPQLA